MSDSDSDEQIGVIQAPQDQKKHRKKVEVSEKMRTACQANAAKAREVRAQKKLAKLAAADETQAILNELVAEKKKMKEQKADPVFGKPEKPTKKKYVSESEEDASEEDESEDSDVEFVLKPKKKRNIKEKQNSSIMDEMAALKAEIAAMRKKSSVNVYVGGHAEKKKTPAELDVLAKWVRDD